MFNSDFLYLQGLPKCPVKLPDWENITNALPRLHIPAMPAVRSKRGWCGCLQVSIQHARAQWDVLRFDPRRVTSFFFPSFIDNCAKLRFLWPTRMVFGVAKERLLKSEIFNSIMSAIQQKHPNHCISEAWHISPVSNNTFFQWLLLLRFIQRPDSCYYFFFVLRVWKWKFLFVICNLSIYCTWYGCIRGTLQINLIVLQQLSSLDSNCGSCFRTINIWGFVF